MFYINYVALCNKIGKSPSAVAEEMGFMRSVVTRWSKGTIPRQATLQKVADYFGVSVEYLLGEEKQPAEKDRLFEISQTIAGITNTLPIEDAELALQLIKALADRRTK